MPIVGAAIGGLLGGALGDWLGFMLKARAQISLCQMNIEQNTSHIEKIIQNINHADSAVAQSSKGTTLDRTIEFLKVP